MSCACTVTQACVHHASGGYLALAGWALLGLLYAWVCDRFDLPNHLEIR